MMDKHTDDRKYRIAHAESKKDTSMQWDLIVAAVENAAIEFFKLEGKQATKMRGRSRITFTKKIKRMLQGIEDDDENAEMVSRAKWLRVAAGNHTSLGNKLVNIARRMKTKGK